MTRQRGGAVLWPVGASSRAWFARLLRDEARTGIVLALVALVALVWASLDPAGYVATWTHQLGGGAGVLRVPTSARAWIDDGAMSLFFLLVGLELSRALVHGELRDPRAALLPIAAALGGMAGAALGYLAVAHGAATIAGVGIPTATDVAFALGALGVLGRRVPPALRLFVLVLAVADDLGSLAVLVLGYSGRLVVVRVAIAATSVILTVVLRRAGVVRAAPYLLTGGVCWAALVSSGVEPALAGVVVGLAIPPRNSDASLLEHRLRPVVNGAVLPVFALANAGVALGGIGLGTPARTVVIALLLARVAGKALGITGATVLAAKLFGTGLPVGVRVPELVGVGAICGVGFTVPLFIATRAFSGSPALLVAARAGLLLASLVAFALGALVLVVVDRRRRRAGHRG